MSTLSGRWNHWVQLCSRLHCVFIKILWRVQWVPHFPLNNSISINATPHSPHQHRKNNSLPRLNVGFPVGSTSTLQGRVSFNLYLFRKRVSGWVMHVSNLALERNDFAPNRAGSWMFHCNLKKMAACASCMLARGAERAGCAQSNLLGITMEIPNQLLGRAGSPKNGSRWAFSSSEIGRGSSGIGRAAKETANMYGMTSSGIGRGRKKRAPGLTGVDLRGLVLNRLNLNFCQKGNNDIEKEIPLQYSSCSQILTPPPPRKKSWHWKNNSLVKYGANQQDRPLWLHAVKLV